MAGATRLSLRSLAVVAAVGVGFGATRVNLRALLLNTFSGPGSVSRIIAIVLLLANFKVIPFVWHLRVLGAIFKHMEFSSHKFSNKSNGPAALFQPTITISRSPLLEIDYNMHKSNSTYFSDLDVTRSNVVPCLFRDGIKKLHATPQVVIGPDGVPAKGKWTITLGAVHCSFKKEIKPYEAYEMWSRILSWDRKWIYIVTHFVKKGAVKPDGYTLNAPSASILASLFGGKKERKNAKVAKKNLPTQETNGSTLEPDVPHKAIFASAISKYVMKLGRLTVHPEVVMEASGLLPPKPGGWNIMSGAKMDTESHANGHVTAEGSNGPTNINEDKWDWKRVEAENARGMKFVEHFAALDELSETFTGDNTPALGVYNNL